MAKNTYKSNTFKTSDKEKKSKGKSGKFNLSFFKDPRFKLAFGFFVILLSFFLFISLLSYMFTGKADQSVVEAFNNMSMIQSGNEAENWLGLYGAITSHFFIFRWFGISAFFIPPLLLAWGFKITFNRSIIPFISVFIFCTFATVWLSLLLGYMTLINKGVSEQ
jgi:S-DNA-T family DNA segregation ATPase FtsK/SpoIIIE